MMWDGNRWGMVGFKEVFEIWEVYWFRWSLVWLEREVVWKDHEHAYCTHPTHKFKILCNSQVGCCVPEGAHAIGCGLRLASRRQRRHRPHALRILRPLRHFWPRGHRPQNPPSHQPRPRRNRHRPHHVRPRRRSQRTAQTTLRQPALRYRHPSQHPPRRKSPATASPP